MRKKHSLAYYIVVFVIVQVIWLSIAGLWISRFVINNVIFNKIGEEYSAHIPDGGAVAILVIGLSLLVLALAGMSMIFRYLNVQFNLARLYDNFIANITHELKTPLAAMQISLDTLKKRQLDTETRDKFLGSIEADTQKLKDLIDNVLVVSRLEQKLLIYNCTVHNADELVGKGIEKIRQIYNVDIDYRYDAEEQQKIVFDEMAFGHVLKNLVDNSIKYSTGEVRVKLRVSQYKKWLRFIYSDNGLGIDAKMRGKVFNKFYRGQNKNNPCVKGTGLGLYLVKEILKYHGGKIKIIKPGKEATGTTFKILLPIFGLKKKRYLKQLMD